VFETEKTAIEEKYAGGSSFDVVKSKKFVSKVALRVRHDLSVVWIQAKLNLPKFDLAHNAPQAEHKRGRNRRQKFVKCKMKRKKSNFSNAIHTPEHIMGVWKTHDEQWGN
jgi:hypothetical protein